MSDMLCPISYFFGWEVEKLEWMDIDTDMDMSWDQGPRTVTGQTVCLP
jgi:hypothetical protein